jgi:hypothetical protein
MTLARRSLFAAAAAAALIAVAPRLSQAVQVVVEAETDVYRYTSADNGAGPMWCGGSTCLVRLGEDVFASGLETLADAKPLNNCRWLLFHRQAGAWRLTASDPRGRTREPCPLAAFDDGRFFLSTNPTLTEPGAYGGPAQPEILSFRASSPAAPEETLAPQWDGAPEFTEHSYRSFAADGPRRELILFQNIGYTHAEWAFRTADGSWHAGRLAWPWGAEYDRPQPIRVCYPTVAVKDRAVFFCGVSDIHEPYEAWRAYKKELTGQEWDYDFRRLFFTWSDDITSGQFHDWVEVASRDKTAGWITPGDLWVAPDGRVHLLWLERAIDTRLRDKFFPDEKQSHALNYAIVRGGEVVLRRTLAVAEEDGSGDVPSAGRFHVTPGGRLLVVYFCSGSDRQGKHIAANRIVEIGADGSPGEPVAIPLERPLSSYFTATVRAGSAPSAVIDLLGTPHGDAGVIRYACVRVADGAEQQ